MSGAEIRGSARLNQALVAARFASSRAHAQALIAVGAVRVDGAQAVRTGARVPEGARIESWRAAGRTTSRAGR